MAMDIHRAKARKLALEEIDRNRGRFDDNNKQDAMLAMLIKKHKLKDKKTGNRGVGEADLTVETYRVLMRYLVERNQVEFEEDVPKIMQLFLKGSLMVGRELLKKLEYHTGDQQPSSTPRVSMAAPGSNNTGSGIHSSRIQPGIQSGSVKAGQMSTGTFAQTLPERLGTTSKMQNLYSAIIDSEEDDLPQTKRRKIAPKSEKGQAILKELQDLTERSDGANSKSTVQELSSDLAEDNAGVKKLKLKFSGAPAKPATRSQTLYSKSMDTNTGAGVQDSITTRSASNSAMVNTGKAKDPADTSPDPMEQRTSIDLKEEGNSGVANLAPNRQEASADLMDSDRRQPQRQPQNPAPVNNEESPHLINPIVPHLVEPMDGKFMQDKLTGFKYFAQQFTYNTLDGIRIDFDKPVDLVPNPGEELKTLYQRVFGENWKEQAFLLIQTEFSTADLLQALLCAALYKVAFVDELPWISPDEAAEKLRDFQPELDYAIALICNRNQTPTFRNLLWNARKFQFENHRFKEEEIAPHALDLAQSFMLTVNAQLHALGGTQIVTNQFWRDQTTTVSEAFKDAISLRGMMRASRYYYEHQWEYGGSLVDGNKVKFCFWPAIWVRTSKEAEREIATKAMVKNSCVN